MEALFVLLAHLEFEGCSVAAATDRHLAPYCQLLKAKPCTQTQLMDQLNKELSTYKRMKDRTLFQEVERMHGAIRKGIQQKVPFEKVMQGFQPKHVPQFLIKPSQSGVSPSENQAKDTSKAKATKAKKARKY